MVDWIYDDKCASACFFRSSVQPPKRKMMLQITQKCNLHCAHCFANASGTGTEMSLELIQNKILPQLLKNQVVKITLTGGEPLCNPQIKDIVQLLLDNHVGVSICTNATLIDTAWIAYVICGDLNVLEEKHVPHYRNFLKWEYDFYGRFSHFGYTDAFRLLHPTENEYSWVGRTNDGYRYDHCFVSKEISKRVVKCCYIHETRKIPITDHSALTLTLDF